MYYAKERAVGLIYTTYERDRHERPGVQLLLSDGRDLSGFSAEEADQFLQPLGDTGLRYEFANVGQVARDYQRGVFGQAFRNARGLLLFVEQMRQLIEAASDTADLRAFAELACQVLGPGDRVHCSNSYVWIKRDEQPERLTIVADHYTTTYCEWNSPLLALGAE